MLINQALKVKELIDILSGAPGDKKIKFIYTYNNEDGTTSYELPLVSIIIDDKYGTTDSVLLYIDDERIKSAT